MVNSTTWYLVYNKYLENEKYSANHNLLIDAFEKENIRLLPINNFEINLIGKKNDPIKNVIFLDKDIYLCKKLERLGYTVFNNSCAIELCDSKMNTYLELLGKIDMPETFSIPKTYGKEKQKDIEDFIAKIGEIIGFPMVIKENYGSFGAQVYLAQDINAAVNICFEHNNRELIFQKYIKTSCGRDLRIFVVGNEAIFGVERTNLFDFRANVSAGGKMIPIELTQKQKTIAEYACKILNLDFGGVDLLFDKDNELLLCEVNSNCHFANAYYASNKNLAYYIAKHLSQKG